MKVFKFGGASVKDADAIRNVTNILAQYPDDHILVVVSAMGKTTNSLEHIFKTYVSGLSIDELVEELLETHLSISYELFDDSSRIDDRLIDVFAQLNTLLIAYRNKTHDFIYDLIVSRGEMLSSILLQEFVDHQGQKACWLNAKEIIITDDTHRAANVNWEETTRQINKIIPELTTYYKRIITQGFIGSTREGDMVTLGREGSDYTGAIIAYCYNIPDYYVWKDVAGVMSADPNIFEQAVLIPHMSYQEAIEMTYFGAKVIHPKTIQPLQRKKIKLHVRSFTDPRITGTLISDHDMDKYPPVIIYEDNQCLLHISTKDFSFIAEDHMAEILIILSKNDIKVNMMQNKAVSFSLCLSDHRGRIDYVIHTLKEKFIVEGIKNLQLVTIRHYTHSIVMDLRANRIIHLESSSASTHRMVVS